MRRIINHRFFPLPVTGYETETIAYRDRVVADGGEVIDIDSVDATYKLYKTLGILTNIKHHSSPSFALKKDANNRVSKLYDISPSNRDFYNDTGAEQPLCEVDNSIYYDGDTKRFFPTSLMTGDSAEMIVVLKAFYNVPPTTQYTGHPHGYIDVNNNFGSHYSWTNGHFYETFWTTGRMDAIPRLRDIDIYNIYAVESKTGVYKVRMNNTVIGNRTSNTTNSGDAADQQFPKVNYKGWIRDYVFTDGLTDVQRTEIHNFLNQNYTIY